MKPNSFLFPIVILLMVACVPATAEPSIPPLESPTATQTLIPVVTVTSTATGVFSDCPLPANKKAVGKLRLVYVTEANLWLLDDGGKPVLLSEMGNVNQVKFSPDGERIVFSRQVGENFSELWMVDANGGEPRRLSAKENLRGQIEILSFSDDEQLVTFLLFANLATSGDAELWAARLDGSRARRLVGWEDVKDIEVSFGPIGGARPDYVTWIPRSHRLTYIPVVWGVGPGDAITYIFDPLAMVDADSEEKDVFLPKGEGGFITYSPGGNKMAVVSPSRLTLLNADGSVIERASLEFSEVTANLEPYIPRVLWSSDSAYVLAGLPSQGADPDLYSYHYTFWPTTLWKISVSASGPEKLSEIPSAAFHFSPDLKRVAYFHGDGSSNYFALYLANLEGTMDLVYDAAEWPNFQIWAPDSRHFAYLAGGETIIGDVCGMPSPITDLTNTEFVGWLDATRFLLLAGRELYLGTASGTNTRLGEFGESVTYDYVMIPE